MAEEHMEDVPLFSSDALEGEYTTWTHLWTIDAGAGDDIRVNWVDNYGNCYWHEEVPSVGHMTDRTGADTVTATQEFSEAAQMKLNKWTSILCKYVCGRLTGTPTTLRVYRRRVQIFARNIALDEAAVVDLRKICMSPNGRYIFVVGMNVALDYRYAMLYEAP